MKGTKKLATGEKGAKSRILIIDGHPLVCEGLAEWIDRQPDLICCGKAVTMLEAQSFVAAQKPDLVLLDLRLGSCDGLALIKVLKDQCPALRILVVSQLDENLYAEKALRSGALGYIMKEQATENLLSAISRILAGQIYLSRKIATRVLDRLMAAERNIVGQKTSSLTEREMRVFYSIGLRKTNRQMAAELNLSVKTIETYRDRLKWKLGLATGVELVHLARERVQ